MPVVAVVAEGPLEPFPDGDTIGGATGIPEIE